MTLMMLKIMIYTNTQIGFIFQFHELLPEFNAIENICIPTLIAGKKIDRIYAGFT